MSPYWSRRIGRHGAIALVSAGMLGVVYVGVPTDFILRRWNLATAYVGLALIALSLLIGPWNVLRGRPNPLSQDLRRDVGIWAAIIGIAHTVIGLEIHMGGQSWLYFTYPPEESHLLPIRTDAFGFANFTGLGSTLVLILLLALSNDWSLRALGARRWKAVQRWNYAGFVLLTLHAVAFLIMEKRVLPVVVVFVGIIVAVLAAQALGRKRSAAGTPDSPRLPSR